MKRFTVEQIKTKATPLLKNAGITRAAIFGSYVRGEETQESDIDIVVDFPKGTTLFDVAEIKIQLEEVLGKPVDLVGYKKIKPRLKSFILSEQVPIV